MEAPKVYKLKPIFVKEAEASTEEELTDYWTEDTV